MAKKSVKPLATRQRKKWQAILQSNDEPKSLGANKPKTIVLDTNVWYSALVYGGNAETVLTFCLQNYQIVMSSVLLVELVDRLKHKAHAPSKWLRQIQILCTQKYLVAELRMVPEIARDPKDKHVIAAAVEHNCKFAVTGDRDLLDLMEFNGVRFVTPVQFLALQKQ